MSTPLSRRQFLTRAIAAAGLAPLVDRAASPRPTIAAEQFPVSGPAGQVGVLVQGAAIKVPSNRVPYFTGSPFDGDQRHHGWAHRYVGDWDGSFRWERGCTNPAFILADLYERLDVEPDWVVADEGVPASLAGGPMIMGGVMQLLGPRLNWQMLVHWGMHCDEVLSGTIVCDPSMPGIRWVSPAAALMGYMPYAPGPRMSVHTVCHTREDMEQLRQDLRMHCLRWQSEDPRYRTSWPGIPYPGDAEVGA